MLSKKISALAASALLFASSAAVAQTSSGAAALSLGGLLQNMDPVQLPEQPGNATSAVDTDYEADGDGFISPAAVVGAIFALIVVGVVIFGGDDNAISA